MLVNVPEGSRTRCEEAWIQTKDRDRIRNTDITYIYIDMFDICISTSIIVYAHGKVIKLQGTSLQRHKKNHHVQRCEASSSGICWGGTPCSNSNVYQHKYQCVYVYIYIILYIYIIYIIYIILYIYIFWIHFELSMSSLGSNVGTQALALDR